MALLIFSCTSRADPDCTDRDGMTDSEYHLICANSRNEISILKEKIHNEVEFFKKWRLEIDKTSKYVKPKKLAEDMLSIEKLVMKAESAITTVAEIGCKFEEYPGFEVFSGSSALNYPLCLQTARENQLIDFLQKALNYSVISKPSFDCEKASTSVEIAICQSPELSNLDVQISETYFEAIKKGSHSVKKDQKNWMRNVRNECAKDLHIKKCLDDVMGSRLRSL